MDLGESRFVDDTSLGIADLHIEERSIFDEIQRVYDEYAHTYNEHNHRFDKHQYAAILITLLQGYSGRLQSLNNQIESDLSTLIWEIETINESLWNHRFGKKETSLPKRLKDAINKVAGGVKAIVDTLKSGVDSHSNNLALLKESYQKLFVEVDDSKRYHDHHFKHLQILFENAVKYSRLQLHVQVLEELTEEILSDNYPEAVSVFEELSNDKRERLRRNHNNSYGHHQPNKDWVKEIFSQEEPRQPSQNRTVERVQGLYKAKFNLKISKTTILRMVDRAE